MATVSAVSGWVYIRVRRRRLAGNVRRQAPLHFLDQRRGQAALLVQPRLFGSLRNARHGDLGVAFEVVPLEQAVGDADAAAIGHRGAELLAQQRFPHVARHALAVDGFRLAWASSIGGRSAAPSPRTSHREPAPLSGRRRPSRHPWRAANSSGLPAKNRCDEAAPAGSRAARQLGARRLQPRRLDGTRDVEHDVAWWGDRQENSSRQIPMPPICRGKLAAA